MYLRGSELAALVLLVTLLLQSAWKSIRKGRPHPNALFSKGGIDPDRPLVNPDRLLTQHHLLPGAYVLMVGPDPGLFSLRAACLVAPGWLTCLDAEPRSLKYIKDKAQERGIQNIVTLAGDASHMPFPASRFDQVILINSLGKIGDQEAALAEMARVLKDNGRLTISDSILAPDCEPPRRVIRLAARTGFTLRRRMNHIFFYTLEMIKPLTARDQNPILVDRETISRSRDMAWPERQHG